jgi:flavorubredoxin
MPIETVPAAAHAVAPETFLIPTIAAEPLSGAFLMANTLVIRGAEPVVVDTGCSLVREQWLATVFSVVEPEDVRWVFVSHDDHDHIGNLEGVLDRCPNATLVANWSMTTRLGGDVELPLDRMRWLDAGQSFHAGDRELHLVRPPLFDSPATRGLFDPSTGVLWAVDTFGALVQAPVLEADDADPALYAESFDALNQWNTPWLAWLDVDRFAAHVRATAALPASAVASAHGPVLRGHRIAAAFEQTLALAARPVPPTFGQETLDELLSTFVPAAEKVA